jgi:hypothetical protein
MANKAKADLVWTNINVESMPKAQLEAYQAFRQAADKANKAKLAFEAAFLPLARAKGLAAKDQDLVYGYKFGRFSVAIKPEKDATSSSKGAFEF